VGVQKKAEGEGKKKKKWGFWVPELARGEVEEKASALCGGKDSLEQAQNRKGEGTGKTASFHEEKRGASHGNSLKRGFGLILLVKLLRCGNSEERSAWKSPLGEAAVPWSDLRLLREAQMQNSSLEKKEEQNGLLGREKEEERGVQLEGGQRSANFYTGGSAGTHCKKGRRMEGFTKKKLSIFKRGP